MKAYINTLTALMIVCQAVLRLAPDSGTTKKYITLVCSLAVLLTMISPIKEIVRSAPVIEKKAEELFSSENKADTTEDELSPAAATLISFIEKKFPDAGNDITLTFVTDESDKVTEVQLYMPEADQRTAERAERALAAELSVNVKVFGGG